MDMIVINIKRNLTSWRSEFAMFFCSIYFISNRWPLTKTKYVLDFPCTGWMRWLTKAYKKKKKAKKYSIIFTGRTVITEHMLANTEKRLCIVNVYCPMAIVENKERYSFKMKFYQLLEDRCRALELAGK